MRFRDAKHHGAGLHISRTFHPRVIVAVLQNGILQVLRESCRQHCWQVSTSAALLLALPDPSCATDVWRVSLPRATCRNGS